MPRITESLAMPATADETTTSLPATPQDVLTDGLRDEAQRLLAQAGAVEVASWIESRWPGARLVSPFSGFREVFLAITYDSVTGAQIKELRSQPSDLTEKQ